MQHARGPAPQAGCLASTPPSMRSPAASARMLDAFKPISTIIAAKAVPERAIMLVGPHGAGKSSTIAKLATELTLHKQPIVLISTDTERMGGVDALHTLAGLLKCEVVVSDSRSHLKGLIAKLLGKAWIFVDSTGANIYEFSRLKKPSVSSRACRASRPILTCPGGHGPPDEAEEMAGVFHFLNIERMIVTRLDAVRRLGGAYSPRSPRVATALCQPHPFRTADRNLANPYPPPQPCPPHASPCTRANELALKRSRP